MKAVSVVLAAGLLGLVACSSVSGAEPNELSDVDRSALVALGVHSVETVGRTTRLLDPGGVEIGRVQLDDHGVATSTLAGATARLDGVDIQCNGVGVVADQAANVGRILKPCEPAIAAYEVLYGGGAKPAGAQNTAESGLLAGPTVCGIPCEIESVSIEDLFGPIVWITLHCKPGSGAVSVTHAMASCEYEGQN